ncbi:methyl-accepting chemotaxis protein [Paenibacillus sp. TRM 82003]|nr:methyl-accepting chemotaxis protein [Paenibacillus sp. TRM 82003]
MKSLLAPFVFLVSRLRYAQKFLLLSVLFLMPLAFLLSIWLRDVGDEISFTEQEITGVEFVQVILPLALEFQQHRGLANGMLNGDISASEKLQEKAEDIAATIARIDELQVSDFHGLHTHLEWDQLKAEWLDLRERVPALTADDSFERHSALIDRTVQFIALVTDNSGLRLDPEIDTYYLMSIATERLPALIENTAYSRGKGNGILSRGAMVADDKLALLLQTDKINSSLLGMQNSFRAALKYNVDLETAIGAEAGAAAASLLGYQRLLENQFLSSAPPSMEPDRFFSEGTNVIDKSNVLFLKVTEELTRLLNERIDSLSSQRNTMLILLGGAIFLITLFFLAFYMNVASAIRELQKGAARIAEGDLRQPVALQTKDELRLVGEAFNRIQGSLRDLLRSNQAIAEQVAASSQELNAISNESSTAMQQIATDVGDISEGADAQQAGMGENTIALHEMAEGISRIADASGEAADAARHAADRATAGTDMLHSTVEQMEHIRARVSHSGDVIRELGERSRRIDELSSIIRELSAQTQLLSLNANIEAARAGEYGRGFAVVASEVGKLAEQSQQAVHRISSAVLDIRTFVGQAERSMEETDGETEQGLRMIRQANAEIESVKDAVQHVFAQIEEVSASTEQLSAGAEEVTAAFTESSAISKQTAEKAMTMAAATQEQLASMQEVQATAEALSSNAVKLQEELNQFKLNP